MLVNFLSLICMLKIFCFSYHTNAYLYFLNTSTIPIPDTEVATINVADEMQIELSFSTNSLPTMNGTDWKVTNICRVGNRYVGSSHRGSIIIYGADMTNNDGFGVGVMLYYPYPALEPRFTTTYSDTHSSKFFFSTVVLTLGAVYDIVIQMNKLRFAVYVNGILFTMRNDNEYDFSNNQSVWLSDPWNEASDVTVHSLIVKDYFTNVIPTLTPTLVPSVPTSTPTLIPSVRTSTPTLVPSVATLVAMNGNSDTFTIGDILAAIFGVVLLCIIIGGIFVYYRKHILRKNMNVSHTEELDDLCSSCNYA